MTDVTPGTVIDQKYEVVDKLGQGGMGVVLAAKHLQLGTRVALKMLTQGAGRLQLERFDREARVVAQLRSEHVCRVLDVGRLADGAPYIVMELLEGLDLSQLLQRRGALPVATAVDYLSQACEALAEAHVAGVVHRDIKPGNLFLTTRPDGSEIVKVLDFGISKAGGEDDQELTATDSVIGSPRFMSPEQLKQSRDVDVRADIWSLGAVLYELVTGRPAFAAETTAELAVVILMQDPPPLSERCPTAPAGFADAVARCTAKDPQDRYENVAALLLAIAPYGTEQARASCDRVCRMLESAGWRRPPSSSIQAHATGASGTLLMEAVDPSAATQPDPSKAAAAAPTPATSGATPTGPAPSPPPAQPPPPPTVGAAAVAAVTAPSTSPAAAARVEEGRPGRPAGLWVGIGVGSVLGAALLIGVGAFVLRGDADTAEPETHETERREEDDRDPTAELRQELEEARELFSRGKLRLAEKKAQALVDRIADLQLSPPTPETRIAGEALLLMGDVVAKRLQNEWPEPRYTSDGKLPYYDEFNAQRFSINKAYFKIIPYQDVGLAQCAKVKAGQFELEVARWMWAAQIPAVPDRAPYLAHRSRETLNALEFARNHYDTAKVHMVEKDQGCRAELAALKVDIDELQNEATRD